VRSRFFPRWILGFLAVLIPFIFASCGSDNIPLIAVVVNPLCVELAGGGTQQFNATVFINSVDQGVDNSAVTWSVVGGDVNGTVSDTGLYQAPNTIPPPANQVAVMATSKQDDQKAGQATVVLSGTCPAVPPP
jgi:hypothetical protein